MLPFKDWIMGRRLPSRQDRIQSSRGIAGNNAALTRDEP
jgi:hypothetical protein